MTHQTVRDWDPELVPTAAGRTSEPDPGCPVEVALRAIAGRWTTLVVRELMHGPARYGELRRALPSLSDKVLSDRLAALRDVGVVDRIVTGGFPSGVTYRLTERGEALRPLMVELYRTGSALLELDAD